MSTPTATSSSPQVRVDTVAFSAESTEGNKRLTSAELTIDQTRYKLFHDGERLCQQFPAPITLTSESQATLRYRKSWRSRNKSQPLDIQRLLAAVQGTPPQDLSLDQDGLRVTFSWQAPLPPTTQSILENCPRFRILIIGKTGVGKSSLIETAFGIKEVHPDNSKRGVANIEEGFVSPMNERFILHDSHGFEPGENINYDAVVEFIRSRQTGLLKDQLHAVWFCMQTPYAGGSRLEAAGEDFFRFHQQTMGAIPLVMVFTKFDLAVNSEFSKRMLAPSSDHRDIKSIRKQAYSEAESIVRQRHDEISQLAEGSDPLPYAAVSTKKDYEDTLPNLIGITHQEVEMKGTPEAQIASVVALMAQRINPRLKVEGSIEVGRKNYWQVLVASPNFSGHTIWDYLSVIHMDIVSVWNFNDPHSYLSGDEFKGLVIEMVKLLQIPSANPNRIPKILALSTGSLIAVVTGLLAAISNPAAPIVLPTVAALAAAVWLYDVYRNGKNVQQVFTAFIVDLTHVMETLFILTASQRNEITRSVIKRACEKYRDSKSNVMKRAHARIQKRRALDGPDAALKMIESLIKREVVDPNVQDDFAKSVQDYFAEIRKLDIGELKLDPEEDW